MNVKVFSASPPMFLRRRTVLMAPQSPVMEASGRLPERLGILVLGEVE